MAAANPTAVLAARRRGLRGAAVLAALLLPHGAPAQDAMSWLMPDIPPASIPLDGKPSDGIADRIVGYIAARWPERQHRYLYANAKRTWLLLEQGDPVCFAAALYTPERRRSAHFAITSLVPPSQLIVDQAAIARLPLNAQGEVDLARLLAERQLRGVVIERRSYGPVLDKLLAARPADAKLSKSSVGDYGRNVLKLVAHGRADYSIDYDYALKYAQATQRGLERLRMVPIAGNGKPMLAGVACPRNAWGLATVRRIDRIIGTPEGAAAAMAAQNAWHTEETRQRFAPQLQEFQRQRASPHPAAAFK